MWQGSPSEKKRIHKENYASSINSTIKRDCKYIWFLGFIIRLEVGDADQILSNLDMLNEIEFIYLALITLSYYPTLTKKKK